MFGCLPTPTTQPHQYTNQANSTHRDGRKHCSNGHHIIYELYEHEMLQSDTTHPSQKGFCAIYRFLKMRESPRQHLNLFIQANHLLAYCISLDFVVTKREHGRWLFNTTIDVEKLSSEEISEWKNSGSCSRFNSWHTVTAATRSFPLAPAEAIHRVFLPPPPPRSRCGNGVWRNGPTRAHRIFR